MTTISICYRSIQGESGSAFAVGIAVEPPGGRHNYIIGFPTAQFTHQKVIITALAYALNTMRPIPNELTVQCNSTYLASLFAKTDDGKYKTTPKTYAKEINELRMKAPNLKITSIDPSIERTCGGAALQAAELQSLCWYGYTPCMTLDQ